MPNEYFEYYFKSKVWNENGTEIIILLSMPLKKKFGFDSIRSKYITAIFKTLYMYPKLLFKITIFWVAHYKMIVPVTIWNDSACYNV